MITLDPWLLLVALAFLVPWGAVRLRLRCWFYRARLAVAVWLMQRKHRATILVHTGGINRGLTVKLTRKVIAARIAEIGAEMKKSAQAAIDARSGE